MVTGVFAESPRVSVFPAQTARNKRNHVSGDVVTEAEPAESDAILTFAGGHPLQLFDVMLAASVIWIAFENCNGAGVVLDQVAMLFRKLPEIAIEGAGSPDGKSRRHEARRRGFVLFEASALRNSARSADAGRVRPARTSKALRLIVRCNLGSRSSR